MLGFSLPCLMLTAWSRKALRLMSMRDTTSVYSSARVFPMLPEQLCTNLTSLNQDQDRLALITEMTFSGDGLLIESNIYRAVVRNKAKLAYDAVSEWFEGVEGVARGSAERCGDRYPAEDAR